MKHILLIATGGTIACKDAGEGLTPQLTSSDLMALVPELDQICQADAVQLMNLDSTNISSSHWLEMAACIQKHYNQYDGFVLTHGTDTMAYTAAALSYLIQNSRKPIVITGAQQSISKRDTDARENLRDAFLYAADDQACGVHIVFDHKVILGTRARKMRTKSYNAFESVDWPETAIIRNGKLVYYLPGSVTGEVFQALKPLCHALVLEGFGVGGLPQYGGQAFYDAVKDWIDSGRVIIMTTQVPFEGSDMDVYQVGQRAKRELGLIEAYGMTTEAVVTKLQWILGQAEDSKTVRSLFQTPIAHDRIFD